MENVKKKTLTTRQRNERKLTDVQTVVKSVAVTDLFPLANQCPCQAIQPHADQSGVERIDSFFLSRTIFSCPF